MKDLALVAADLSVRARGGFRRVLLRAAAGAAGTLACLCAGADDRPLADRDRSDAPPVLKRLRAAVRTPLFVEENAGTNTIADVTLTAAAIPIERDAPGEVSFSPSLGDAGRGVLRAVTEHLRTRHRGWPVGHRVEIAFNAPIAPDDAAAAGLAVATLLDAMIIGWEPDRTCAVIGHLAPDGTIVNVSSALARLTIAARSHASRILLAEKNVTDAADCLVNEGVAGFSRAQMFAVKQFDEVPPMAAAKPAPEIAAAVAAFAALAKTLTSAGAGAGALLKEPDTQEELRGVLENWPNHVTARLLLGRAIGRYLTFSLPGSVEAIERIAVTLRKGLNSNRPHALKELPAEKIEGELATLRRAVERVDPHVRPYLGAIIRYGETALTSHRQPPRKNAEAEAFAVALTAAARTAQDERQKLAAALIR